MIAWVLEDLIAPWVDNLFWVGIKFLILKFYSGYGASKIIRQMIHVFIKGAFFSFVFYFKINFVALTGEHRFMVKISIHNS